MVAGISQTQGTQGAGSVMDEAKVAELATKLNVDQATLSNAIHSSEAQLQPLVQQLSQGGLDQGEQDQLQAALMDGIKQQLAAVGKTLTPEEEMELLNFCEECVDKWEQDAAAQYGFQIDPNAPAANAPAAGANPMANMAM